MKNTIFATICCKPLHNSTVNCKLVLDGIIYIIGPCPEIDISVTTHTVIGPFSESYASAPPTYSQLECLRIYRQVSLTFDAFKL